jgi:raffinose/stachyose/melibiose transport system permease protein
METSKKTDTAAILFLLPAAIIYLSVIIFPVCYSFYLSLFTGSGIKDWVFSGFENYVKLFSDQVFFVSLKNTVIWIVLTLVITISISLTLAVQLNKRFMGRTFFRGFFFFPWVVAPIAVAIIWRWIYNPTFGFINQFFSTIGINFSQTWTSDTNTALLTCFVASQWQAIGQPMILFLAGLQMVPTDVLEAATIDGASGPVRFFRVTVPLMKETFIIVISTLIISAMKVYDIVRGLTDGGPHNASEVLATYMYSQTFDYNNWGYGTAIACVMVILMLFVVVPYMMFTAKKR